MGNEDNINIWEDTQLPLQHGCRIWSPKANNFELSRVFQIVNGDLNTWNMSLVNTTFLPFEATQISQILLPYKIQVDQSISRGNKDRYYTAKFGYHQIKLRESLSEPSSSNITGNTDQWKKLWRLRILPKQAHLLWRILNNVVPVRAKLHSRVVPCPLICPHCERSVETIDHTFRDCVWATQI